MRAQPIRAHRTVDLATAVLCSLVSLLHGNAEAALTDPIPSISGDTWTQVPFGGVLFDPPMRMQQVYEATALETSMPDGAWITGMWFVSDESAGRGWGASLRAEISLGLTTRGPDQLSAYFADNFSIAPIPVKPIGPLLITSEGPGSVVQISFENPYFYDPSAGNLLLEIKNFVRPELLIAGPLDAWDVMGDAVSRVYARGDANAAVGTVDTIGLTTLFVFTAVPEPSTVALLALGACGLGWHWVRRRRPPPEV